MSTYAFRAVDVAGVPSRGEVEASTKAHVSDQLRQRGLIVLDISEERESFKLEELIKRFKGVGMRDLAIFSRQFATLIAAGMPMLRTLYTLEDQTEDEMLKEAIAGVRQDVEAGSSLAAAMERQPNIFDRLYRAMVRSGESSGRLEEALERVAYQLEKLDALRRQVRSAMVYPAFVFSFAVLAMAAVVAFIVPVFAGIYEQIAADNPGESAQLPFISRITVGISHGLTSYWYAIIVGLVAGGVAFFQWKKTDRGRQRWDRLKLRLPAKIGDVIQKVALARWSRTFSGAVASGVPILQSIQITGQTSGNTVIEEAMAEVYESVRQGGSIVAPIERNPIFPPMVAHMVAVGEDTGQLEQMLSKIADFYEAEVDAKVKALTSLLEPLMIMFVGGVVGFIVISMYMPIFTLYDKIR
ncbi:MAG: type pilus assembly protein PilC [Solirubrobacterales bacterium]|jgi:type IV pilus assembly protein PilC|nr:type pilus assembly protein PilC [Solirubrobacterales bacterium]MDX6661978.1 type pilus assembly protein PilC [Solirubrobacterales bacterium]